MNGNTWGGGKLMRVRALPGEQLLMSSRHDVEEVSEYAKTLNPVNLFLRGSTFFLGRLFLTDRRLLLLLYSKAETEAATAMGDAAYQGLDAVGLGIPQPKIQFSQKPIEIPLQSILEADGTQKQYWIHPLLVLTTSSGSFKFKMVPGEDPRQWARLIGQLSGCRVL